MTGVLIGTCIWSLALRGKSPDVETISRILGGLINQHRAIIIGPIRQELLSGYSEKSKYDQLRAHLSFFPNEPILDVDYEAAAEYSNLCRVKGVQGSHIDFLTCAVASRMGIPIFTKDKDFKNYANHLPIKFFETS